MFKNEPGVSVTGSAGRPQNITIRGIGGNRVLIIKDGVRVSDGFGANDLNDKVGRFSFDLDDVKQIEVAKGAGSALHGSDAIGGTVVITTKQPEDYLQGQDAYLSSKVLHDGSSDKQKLSATGAARWARAPTCCASPAGRGTRPPTTTRTASRRISMASAPPPAPA